MNLKELQKTWSQISNDPSGGKELSEGEIREMLGKRTFSLMERIDKNIRRGFFILFLIIAAFFIYDLFFAPEYFSSSESELHIPDWVTMLDSSVNIIILLVFLLFFIRYHQVRKQCGIGCEIRQVLLKIIRIMSVYRQLFTLALIIFLLTSATGFIAGFYKGILVNNLTGNILPIVIIGGILSLSLLTGLMFLVIRFVFRKLYANYLVQLKETLKELDELQ